MATAPDRGGRHWRHFSVLGIAVGVTLLAAAVIRVPYYALSPGSIRATTPLIELGDADRDPDAGQISFATVSVDGRVNLLQALSGWWDDAIDIVPESRVLRGQSPQENRDSNQVLMEDSKHVAVDVALAWLGVSTPRGALVAPNGNGSPPTAPLEVGDVIVSFDDAEIRTARQLADRVSQSKPGTSVELGVLPAAVVASGRPNAELSVEKVRLTLAATAADPAVASLPATVRDAFDVGEHGGVSIGSGGVGGPSAGLAFTLGVIDLLSAGDLTGGEKVAVTGTIDPTGRVGPIGGIEQKAVAARRAGITLFLVPDSLIPSELAEARRLAGSVELVEVGSLREALDALAAHGGAGVALPALAR